ncbi:PEP-CTERM sorting domain-containing protein [Lacipirellula sp.]|uniref:PEP-CTERM sorting domain-containing protein n=1 Tax=Lacipirellula sp. TaxID=2691419 RepID=UPI003D0C5EF2
MSFSCMRATAVGLVILSTCLTASFAAAASYNESIQGELSSVAASPTPFVLEAGANALIGSAGTDHSVGTVDYDLVALTIPAGLQLDSITIVSYSNQSAFGASFFALQPGSPWLDGFGFDILGFSLMGWAHVHASDTGSDLLPMIHENANPPEFTVPVASGVYTMLMEDIDTPFNYSLLFNVSAVPEPSSLALAGAACMGVAALRRRRAA